MHSNHRILNMIRSLRDNGEKGLALLVDPDSTSPQQARDLSLNALNLGVDFIFCGGSLVLDWDKYTSAIASIRQASNLPLVIFPGNMSQIDSQADAILFLSLISGRNPEMLIGRHVEAAPLIKSSGLEAIPTGYMLIGEGIPTSVQYISQTLPIPSQKADLAVATAIAGEMLGLGVLYLEAGSGAENPIPAELIHQVREAVSIPLIVGGGIRDGEQAFEACAAGADMIVVGTAIEQSPGLLGEIASAVQSASSQTA